MQALTWIAPDEPLPHPSLALQEPSGLLCAGVDLTPARLLEAYRQGIFPWYSRGQPVLWWSPDPRMVLYLEEFAHHRSLRKLLSKVIREEQWKLKLDTAFPQVMRCCAQPREGQDGTWITEDIVQSYTDLHREGLAHSFEVWENKELIAGLYGVSLGQMFFGESMFTHRTNASKLALAGLVNTLAPYGFRMIDCQQKTRHLTSFGGREISRELFMESISHLIAKPAPPWASMTDASGCIPWPFPS